MLFFTDVATNLAEAGALALGWSNPSHEAPMAPAGSRWLPKSLKNPSGCKAGRLRTVRVGWQHLRPPTSPRWAPTLTRCAWPGAVQGWLEAPVPPGDPGELPPMRGAGLGYPSPTWDPSARPVAAGEERALRAEPFWAPPRPVGAAAPEADGALGHSNGAERPRRR